MRETLLASPSQSKMLTTDFKLVTVDVQMLGPDALREIGTYTLKMTGTPGEDVGKYLVIWRKQGTDWKIDSDIWNTNNGLPAGAAGALGWTPAAAS
jgi:hypothetical protein